MYQKIVFILFFSLLFRDLLSADFSLEKGNLQEYTTPLLDSNDMRIQGYDTINKLRISAGLVGFEHNEALEASVQAHASYLVKNHEEGHKESRSHQGFTGRLHTQRALEHGYMSKYTSENLSTKNLTISNSIDGLFSAIYHRFAFLDPTMDEIGIGIDQDKNDRSNTAFVYVMGNKAFNQRCKMMTEIGYGKFWSICKEKQHMIADQTYKKVQNDAKRLSPKLIVYPYENQEEVPTVFYEEHPDPLPQHKVSGFPVSVTFNDYYLKHVNVNRFEITDEDGTLLKSKLINSKNDPNHRLKPSQFALMPLERLEYDTNYHVALEYEVNGKSVTKKWQFHTRSFEAPLYRIESNFAKISIAPQSSNILYFPPANSHELLSAIQYPKSVKVHFIDHNTVRVTVDKNSPDDFKIKTKKREVHLHIER